MIVFERFCRGCEMETTTYFVVDDTAGLVTLNDVETIDYSRPDEDGGSLQKRDFNSYQ